MRKFRRLVVVLGVDALTLTQVAASCVPWSRPEGRVAVSRDTAGQLIIHIARCPGEKITNVTVKPVGDDGETEPRTLWAVKSAGEPVGRVVAGMTPSGFTLTRPLKDDDWGSLGRLGVSVEDSDGIDRGMDVWFEFNELPTDAVFDGDVQALEAWTNRVTQQEGVC